MKITLLDYPPTYISNINIKLLDIGLQRFKNTKVKAERTMTIPHALDDLSQIFFISWCLQNSVKKV